jgi:MFS family permease
LTRNVFAIGLLSLFSDAGHELTTAILPLFLATFAGSAAALGVIEGFSDASSSVLNLWMSFYSDRVGKRKPILAVGYFVTAMMGTLGFVTAIWQIVLIRMVAWMGRGARGPVRDALLSESVPAQAHGRAFGFESMMDTLGAIIGPAIALSLVGVIALHKCRRQLSGSEGAAYRVCHGSMSIRDPGNQGETGKNPAKSNLGPLHARAHLFAATIG